MKRILIFVLNWFVSSKTGRLFSFIKMWRSSLYIRGLPCSEILYFLFKGYLAAGSGFPVYLGGTTAVPIPVKTPSSHCSSSWCNFILACSLASVPADVPVGSCETHQWVPHLVGAYRLGLLLNFKLNFKLVESCTLPDQRWRLVSDIVLTLQSCYTS